MQAYVLVVGDGGLVTHLVSPEDQDTPFYELTEEKQVRWIEAIWPIEPIHYVGHAEPAALLFQNGTMDKLVPPANAISYQKAGSQPKTIIWYESGHGLPLEKLRYQVEWLNGYIDIEEVDILVDNLILMNPVEDLVMLLPRIRTSAIVIDRLMLLWFLLVAGSLVYLMWDLWLNAAAPGGIKLIWLLVGFFLGPFGLLVYLVSYRRVVRSTDPLTTMTTWSRSLGSTVWSVAGNFVGGVGVIGIVHAFPDVFSGPLQVVPLMIALPLITGFAINQIVKSVGEQGRPDQIQFHRPFLAELISTNMVLAGGYLVVILLTERWFERWYSPTGWDMTTPPVWVILSLGALAGVISAYPFHVWMIRYGMAEWGLPSPADEVSISTESGAKKSTLIKAALILLSYVFLACGVGLSILL